MRSTIFWDVTLWSQEVHRHFGRTYSLHLQDWKKAKQEGGKQSALFAAYQLGFFINSEAEGTMFLWDVGELVLKSRACYLLHVGFLVGFSHEDGDTTLLWNFRWLSTDYMVFSPDDSTLHYHPCEYRRSFKHISLPILYPSTSPLYSSNVNTVYILNKIPY
jgi:hypothetical protein